MASIRSISANEPSFLSLDSPTQSFLSSVLDSFCESPNTSIDEDNDSQEYQNASCKRAVLHRVELKDGPDGIHVPVKDEADDGLDSPTAGTFEALLLSTNRSSFGTEGSFGSSWRSNPERPSSTLSFRTNRILQLSTPPTSREASTKRSSSQSNVTEISNLERTYNSAVRLSASSGEIRKPTLSQDGIFTTPAEAYA